MYLQKKKQENLGTDPRIRIRTKMSRIHVLYVRTYKIENEGRRQKIGTDLESCGQKVSIGNRDRRKVKRKRAVRKDNEAFVREKITNNTQEAFPQYTHTTNNSTVEKEASCYTLTGDIDKYICGRGRGGGGGCAQ
jgi:hypothetical protein